MPLLNYTTQIDADKTCSEIARMLSRAGAKAVLTEYDEKDGYVTAISFQMKVSERDVGFRLPSDWKPVLAVLEQQKRRNSRIVANREQAVRVAWRIVKDWVEAQLAIIETRMVNTEQVFLPYAIARDGQTLYEHVQTNPGFLLGDGN